MIKSIVREHHWPSTIIDGLFVDRIDYRGIEFWYEDVAEVSDKLENNGS